MWHHLISSRIYYINETKKFNEIVIISHNNRQQKLKIYHIKEVKKGIYHNNKANEVKIEKG